MTHKLVWFVPQDALDATREAAFEREERVPELRVETVVAADRVGKIVQALVAAHPDEELAYELYAIVDVES